MLVTLTQAEIWIPLFFARDLSMIGYLFGNRAGAFAYNLFHHRGIALLITGAGFVLHQEWLIALGILLFAHSSFDRMLGFGLKYNRGLSIRTWAGPKKKNLSNTEYYTT